ncbi:MAG: acetyl-CoA carboxylase biotin carboxyl carrier protein subunit [Desulfurococcaceae archaeon]|nr:MAG: acetyl-CoA carboxylase biotin carboxyl carrier protein subunit [Desulfurococcaceae archaeon]
MVEKDYIVDIKYIVSPLPGLVAKVMKSPGDSVTNGDTVVVLNVMKTEVPITSEYEGIVKEIYVKEWDEVDVGSKIASIEVKIEK